MSTITNESVDQREDFLPSGYLTEKHLENLETWLESKFRIPVIGVPVGLDALIGLIPGVGDLATSGMSAVFVADAFKIGSRKRTVAKMLGNIVVNLTLGIVPFFGDLFDFAFRSNTKNLKLLKLERDHLAQKSQLAKHIRANV